MKKGVQNDADSIASLKLSKEGQIAVLQEIFSSKEALEGYRFYKKKLLDLAFIKTSNENSSSLKQIFSMRHLACKSYAKKAKIMGIDFLSTQGKKILHSFIHMHCNRLLGIDPFIEEKSILFAAETIKQGLYVLEKKKIFILVNLLLICVFLSSGYYLKITIQKANSYSMSTRAFLYLHRVLNIMEKKFIYKDNIDWDLIKKEVYKKAEGSVLTSDTYLAIQLARSLINENHGFFASPSQMKMFEKEEYPIKPPVYRLLEKNVAYLSLFTFPSISDEADQAYSKQLQTAIRALDSSDVDKWIIDLRENQGGNMWAMLLGLGPLLDKECIGFFVRNNGEKTPWKYKKNVVKQGNYCCLTSSLPLYQLKKIPKIAVLIGNKTASSGEAVAVAFSGQKNVRFFGQETSGFANGTYAFFLSDGACLLLPVMLFSNRLGQIFYANIAPDEIINANEETNLLEDHTVEAAIDWLCNSC